MTGGKEAFTPPPQAHTNPQDSRYPCRMCDDWHEHGQQQEGTKAAASAAPVDPPVTAVIAPEVLAPAELLRGRPLAPAFPAAEVIASAEETSSSELELRGWCPRMEGGRTGCSRPLPPGEAG